MSEKMYGIRAYWNGNKLFSRHGFKMYDKRVRDFCRTITTALYQPLLIDIPVSLDIFIQEPAQMCKNEWRFTDPSQLFFRALKSVYPEHN